MPLKPPAVKAASGITAQLPPPLVETSRVPASKHYATDALEGEGVPERERRAGGDARARGDRARGRSLGGRLSENQECVGSATGGGQAQSLAPLTAAVGPARVSKPPPDCVPSKVSVSVGG